MELFTIFDSKAKIYQKPVFAKNQHILVRDVVNMFQQPKEQENLYLTNAEDFSIFKVGSFDEQTGLFTSQNLEHVANMHDLRAMVQTKPGLGIVPT